MKTSHVAPGDSAGGSMRQAVRNAGRSDEVLRFRDDLSCGPIDSDDPSARGAWWSRFYDEGELMAYDTSFWNRVLTTDERLVVWFGRHSASELAFFLAWVDRLGDRPYDVIDVTAKQWPMVRKDGTAGMTRPAQAVAHIQPWNLQTLLGTERPLSVAEKDEFRRQWGRLREQNALFRIVTPTGLTSVPLDHFDPLLIKQTTKEWRKAARVIGDTIGHNSDPYCQVGDVMLLQRVIALVGEGKLLAEGDPRDMHTSRIRLPD